jgi:hypothetical protein
MMMSQTPEPASRPRPPFTEHVTDAGGSYTREWYCTPVGPGTSFHVLQGEWNEDFTVQRIYEAGLD